MSGASEEVTVQEWLSRHKIAVSVAALAALTVALVMAASLFRKPPEKLDPQEEIGVHWIKPVGSEPAYAGSEACRSCHPSEFKLYSASPHSRTVHAITQGEERAEFGSGQTVTDERNGVLYSVRKGDGKNQVIAATSASKDAAAARWAFGSGTQAWTYLAQNGDKFLQLRITYYPVDGTWNFTPGSGPGSPFHVALGDPYNAAQAAACFGCHSTVLTGTRKSLDLAHSRLNVGCESCHGPCRSHIESVTAGNGPGSKSPIIKPPLHAGAESMQLCGSCHRVPVAVKDEAASLGTQVARFPGVALPKSRCFTESAGKLACVTCHNPHESTRQQTEASFDGKCIGCHSAPHGATCSRGETTACVSCHMPLEQIAGRLPLRFHNHWIRRDPLGAE
jgi:hypothetical protein